jgi:3-isopropylmalate/(R)-2-methylmalate dehydratase small subunit
LISSSSGDTICPDEYYSSDERIEMMEQEQKTRGKAFVVGDDIDTDQIIPAEFLSYNPSDPAERKFFGKYALSGLPAGGERFVEDGQFTSGFAIIIAGRNFGCGSSREHAPLAIAEAGCRAVVAESYARIFYRNSVNGGYLAPYETSQRLIDKIATGDEVELDAQAATLTHIPSGTVHQLESIGEAAEIIAAGGVFNYARESGMLK